MQPTEDQQPDGYYDEDITGEEIDLSFLNDDEEDEEETPKPAKKK